MADNLAAILGGLGMIKSIPGPQVKPSSIVPIFCIDVLFVVFLYHAIIILCPKCLKYLEEVSDCIFQRCTMTYD